MRSTLYYAAPSPFARKVRVLIRELGLRNIDEVAVHTTPLDPSTALTSVNPLSKIPTLVLADGQALYDSRVICEALLSGEDGYVPVGNGPERWNALRRHALADGILDAGLLHRFETVLRPDEKRWGDWLAAQMGKIDRGLAELARDVPRADSPGLDAIATACALGWLEFRMASHPWRDRHPELASFHQQMAARASMQATRPDA